MDKIKILCARDRRSLDAMLRHAGVSRNAFYTLARRSSVVPESIQAVARTLSVPVSQLLEETLGPDEWLIDVQKKIRRLMARHPDADADNLRHTFILLNEPPMERLRRALRRGRHVNLR